MYLAGSAIYRRLLLADMALPSRNLGGLRSPIVYPCFCHDNLYASDTSSFPSAITSMNLSRSSLTSKNRYESSNERKPGYDSDETANACRGGRNPR